MVLSVAGLVLATPALANSPPDCDQAEVAPGSLWPANHKMVPVAISGVTDPDGDPVELVTICIKQDEPLDSVGDGSTEPDAAGLGTGTPVLRSERSGAGNGRVYRVDFLAQDPAGAACIGRVSVGVPHNRKSAAVDDGPRYDSVSGNLNCSGKLPNVPPVALDSFHAGPEDEPLALALSVTDEDGDALAIEIVSGPASGSLSGEYPSLVYVPAENFNGQDTFRFRAFDGKVWSDIATVTVLINPVNDAPRVNPGNYDIAEDSQLSAQLTGVDVDGDPLTFRIVTEPLHGTASMDGGVLIYTPDRDFFGTDSVMISASDGELDSLPASQTINVIGINDLPLVLSVPPVAAAPGSQWLYPLVVYDAETDLPVVEPLLMPAGMFWSPLTRTFYWTPQTSQAGPQVLQYLVDDGDGGVLLETHVIDVSVVAPAPPVVTSTPDTDSYAGAEYQYQIELEDTGGNYYSFELVSGPAGMTVTPLGGLLYWTPAGDQTGDFVVVVRAVDADGNSVQLSWLVTVELDPANRPPLFASQPADTVAVGATFEYQARADDPDGDLIRFSLVRGGAGMSLTRDGLLTWTPMVAGEQEVVIEASDGRGGIASQSFAVTAVGDISPPVITSQPGLHMNANPYRGGTFIYDVEAIHAEEPDLQYGFSFAPEGAPIDATSGLISWRFGASYVYNIYPTPACVADTYDLSLGVIQETAPGLFEVPVTNRGGQAHPGTVTLHASSTLADGTPFERVQPLPAIPAAGSHVVALNPQGEIFASHMRIELIGAGDDDCAPLNDSRLYPYFDIEVATPSGATANQRFFLSMSYFTSLAPYFSTRPPLHGTDIDGYEYRYDYVNPNATAPSTLLLTKTPGMVLDGAVQTLTIDSADTRSQLAGSEVLDPFCEAPDRSAEGPMDLSEWHAIKEQGSHLGKAAWNLSADGLSVIMDGNAPPSYLVSPFEVEQGAYRINVRPGPGDDDRVGFVWGVQGDQNYYKFTWDSGGYCLPGCMEVIRVDSHEPLFEGEHPSNELIYQLTGIRWKPNTDYSFIVNFNHGKTVIEVWESGSGSLVHAFAVYDDRYPSGHMGPFVHSQDATRFSVERLPTMAQADLVVTGIHYDETGSGGGNVLATLLNRGSMSAGAGAVVSGLVRNDYGSRPGPNTALDSVSLASDLAPGEKVEVDLGPAIRDTRFSPNSFEITVDSDEQVAECNEANNRSTFPAAVLRLAYSSNYAYQRFGITLRDTPERPRMAAAPTLYAAAGRQFDFMPSVNDDDGSERLRFAATGAPANSILYPESGLLRWFPTQQDIGEVYQPSITVTDLAGLTDEKSFTVVVHAPPVFLSTAPIVAQIGETYVYRPQALDPDGGVLSLALVSGPAGAQFSQATGELTWSGFEAGQLATFVLTATDDEGAETTQSFRVGSASADGLNQAPEIVPIADATVNFDFDVRIQGFLYRVVASDADGDALLYQLSEAPLGMSIDGRTGQLEWRPAENQIGVHPVTVTVFDYHGGQAETSFLIRVNGTSSNSAPNITVPDAQQLRADTSFSLTLTASDQDGDPLFFVLRNAPGGMSVGQSTGVLSWQPTDTDVGDHLVEFQVMDSAGASALGQFTVSVLPSGNRAPEILSAPPATVTVGQWYRHVLDASDQDGDTLGFELYEAPAGMTVGANGALEFLPRATQVGTHSVRVRVFDGLTSSFYSFALTVLPAAGNTAPQFVTLPTDSVVAGQAYRYDADVQDAEGDGYSFRLLLHPLGMSVTRDGVIAWVPDGDELGVRDVVLQVSDAQGNVAWQSWQIKVFQNGAPLITSVPVTSAIAGQPYQYQVFAEDPDGLPVTFMLMAGPDGMSLSPSGMLTWEPGLSDVGGHTVIVRASDGALYIDQEYTLSVDDSVRPLSAGLSLGKRYLRVDEVLAVRPVAEGGLAPYAFELTLDGDPVPLFGGQAEVSLAEPGSYQLALQTTDSLGQSVTASETLYVSDGDDNQAPTVRIDGPLGADRISSPTVVTGVVNDAFLAEWSLTLQRAGSGAVTTVAGGAAPVNGGVLGELDPTVLVNGLYQLTLSATDYAGQTASTTVAVLIDGNLKVGNFSITLEDLSIPVSGIPIRVTRTYDSRRRQENLDFGHGWSVGYQDVLISETSEPTQGWRQYSSFELFEADDNRQVFEATCTAPFANKQVAVTLPNGEVERFRVRAAAISGGVRSISNPDCYLTGSRYFDLAFEPDERTDSTLEADNGSGLYLANPGGGDLVADIVDRSGPKVDRYTLTTREGYIYKLDQAFGVRRIIDPNGQTLDYTDDGIIHSAGKSVLFERDGQGRIQRVIDPSGHAIAYRYDSVGDLVAVTDAAGYEATLVYQGRSHLLADIHDPLGRRLVRNLYDDEGRLIAQEDSAGNRTDFNHDVEGRQSVVTDRRGNASIFYYDDRGNITSKVDATGKLWQYTYDAEDNQLSETNPLGESSESTFNEQGDQLAQVDALGHVTRFEYNERGQETRIVDALGRAFENGYDGVGNLLSIEDPLGNVASNVIDDDGLVSSTTDLAGHTTFYAYDASGNKTRETDAEGNISTWTYDDNGNVLSETVRRVVDGAVVTETTSYEYDALNRVVAVTDAEGSTTRTEFDAAGNEVASIDALGRRTEMVYDAYGRVVATHYPDGSAEYQAWDAEGNLIEQTDRLGRTTVMTYDALNRLLATEYPDGATASTEYDDAGRVVAEIDALNNRTEYQYDAAGRRTAVVDALGNRHEFEYDANGNLVRETDANGHVTEYDYNALDQKVATRFHDASTMRDTFDALSRKVAMEDQAGVVTQYGYDSLGRLTLVRDALGGETSYSYDSQGNKLTQTDAEGRTTRWEYDALGRVTARILPLGQRETFEYDAVGNQTRHVDFKGQVTTSEFDAMNRLVRRTYDDGTVEAWRYDAGGRVIETALTTNSQVQVTDYVYDSRDRLIREAKPDGSVLEYTYDLNGNKTSVTVTPAGGSPRTVSYTYDALNRLETVVDEHGTTTYTYDAVGNRASVTQANGVETRYTYDALNRLLLLTSRASDGTLLQQYDYTLDATGRRTLIEEHTGRLSAYVYDDLYRLVEEAISDPANGDHQSLYQYDAVGNRTQATVNGVVTTYDYDANDRLLSQGGTSYTYDDNGNTLVEISGAGSTSYVWDARNRLVEATTPAGTLLYGYDINGIRTSRSESGVTTNFVVDHNQQYAQVLAETEGGVATKQYTYGDDLLSQTEGAGQERFFLYDGLGTTRALAEGSEALTDTYAYEAFGELLASTGSADNAYRYTGEQYDSGLDQYYLRARYYDQGVGRFSQMDAWMGRSQAPITLHKYLYANGDPGNSIDPSGRAAISEALGASIRGLLTTFSQGGVRLAARSFSRTFVGAALRGGTLAIKNEIKRCVRSKGKRCRILIPIVFAGNDLPNQMQHILDAQIGQGSNIGGRRITPVLTYQDGKRNRNSWPKRQFPSGFSFTTGTPLGLPECEPSDKISASSSMSGPVECDEYPFNASREGGYSNYKRGRVSARFIPAFENRAFGLILQAATAKMKRRQRYLVVAAPWIPVSGFIPAKR